MKIFTLILTLSLAITNVSQAEVASKDSYKTIYEIPRFIDLPNKVKRPDFIENNYNTLQKSLISGPRAISFLDDNGYVTRKSLEKYKRQAIKKTLKKQKRSLLRLDQNNDGALSLDEYISQKQYAPSDVIELYKLAKTYGIDAVEQHAPMLQKLRSQVDGQGHRYIVKKHLALFMELDQNDDLILSKEEVNTPAPSVVDKETSETIANFESFLSLSEDKEQTSLAQIIAAIEKTFNTLDVDNNNEIDRYEHRAFITAFSPKHTCPPVRLSNEDANTYAVAISSSRVFTPIQFNDKFKTQTRYSEVEIKKQKQKLNLVLSARNNTIWSIYGDVKSIRHIIVVGPGEEKNVHSGVIGVPKEKVTFANRRDCWKTEIPNSTDSLAEKNNFVEQGRNILEAFAGTYPHLLKTQTYASKITIQSTPEIILSEELSEALKAVPKGYNPKYWNAFLKYYTSGFKDLEVAPIHLGAYAYKNPALPSWFGIAQLEHDGILEPLNIDEENRKAAFLIKKDLPYYILPQSKNPTFFTFIKDKDALSIPEAETVKTSQFCVMNRQGKGFVNAKRCNVANLALLKPKAKENQLPPENPVFLSLDKYSVVMPIGQEAIDIKLNIDHQRCEEKYGADFANKCIIPSSIMAQDLPLYALKIEPALAADVIWKDRHTLSIAPKEPWKIDTQYSITLNLDNLNIPQEYLINDDRSAKTTFFTDRGKLAISDVNVSNNLFNAQSFTLAMDISSNIVLEDMKITLFHVPKDAIRPDEHTTWAGRDYVYFSEGYIIGPKTFDISPATTRLKMEVRHHDDGVYPTHMSVSGGSVIPVWLPLDDSSTTSPEINALIEKAQNGDTKSQIELGRYYWSGEDTPIVLSKVRYWLESAASQGDVEAYALLGDLNLNRYNQEYDRLNEAFYWYMKAAKENHTKAQFMLGEIHSYINRVYYDEDEMMKWYTASEQNGHIAAMNRLGSIYKHGLSNTDKNLEQAERYFKKAADLNDPLGLYNLAQLIYEREEDATLDKAYSLAKQAFETTDRSDVRIFDKARKIIVNVLLKKYEGEEDFKAKTEKIIQDVFKDFQHGYQRMWIANAFLTRWDGTFNMLSLSDALIQKQKAETPDLEELQFVEMLLNLKNSYHSGGQDEQNVRMKAINLFESMRGKTEFDIKVIENLAYLYRDVSTLKPFLDDVRMREYIPFQKLSFAYGLYLRHLGQISNVLPQSYDPEDDYMAKREEIERKKDPTKMNQSYLDSLKADPNRAWTNGNYAAFLLFEMKDYDGAIKYGNKALKLLNYPRARCVTGMAHLVKASQLFKDKDTRSKAKLYVQKAKSYGLNKGYIENKCETFCDDINTMLRTYKKMESQQPI